MRAGLLYTGLGPLSIEASRIIPAPLATVKASEEVTVCESGSGGGGLGGRGVVLIRASITV